MQLFNLFSTFANQYTQKYIARANANRPDFPPGLNRDLLPPTAASPERPGQTKPISDTYVPTEPNENEITDPIYTQPDNASDNPVAVEIDNPDTVEIVPGENEADDDQVLPGTNDTPVTITRQAELGYNLTLQFDMATFTQTIERMADGEISEVDQIAMATFGLSTEFELRGREVIEIETAQATEQNFHALSLQSFRSRQASMFTAQSRDFQGLSFMREATDMRQKIDIKFQDNARRAVNKFALRYRSDTQFSFNFAQRLNIQTEQVSDQMPESLGGYLDSAGDVAGTGTTEMMAAFFDAVEGYLSTNHEQTSESVTAFFGQAASALGFSGTQVAEFAETNLTNTVDNFFERVSSAVSELRALHLGEPPPEPVSPTVFVEIPADYGSPDSVPMDTSTERLQVDDPQYAVA